jgi:acyl-CoA synthetase (AMP-forming)/AMP-acid ligase II
VATLAWNGYRHLELYFGVSGSGRVLHTINPRLHPDQIVWIANHAEDQVLFFDMSFLPIVQAVHAAMHHREALGGAVRRATSCPPTAAFPTC